MNTALHLQSPKTGLKSFFFLIIEIRNNLNNQMHYKKRFSKTKNLKLKKLTYHVDCKKSAFIILHNNLDIFFI